MKIREFLKKEIQGWHKHESIGLLCVITIILINAFCVKDNPIAVCSAICGILYTIIAGKGKISCYFFGLMGSGCYIWLSFSNALWGNMMLYLCYYIPMQVLGIFKWKQHLKTDTKEIIKVKLSKQSRISLLLAGVIGCVITAAILKYLHDKSPVIDGITTFLSILGMYLTVRRAIEQWVVWMIVNALSLVMWLNLVLHGAKTISTVIMWGVYLVLAIYFYIIWNKDMKKQFCELKPQ